MTVTPLDRLTARIACAKGRELAVLTTAYRILKEPTMYVMPICLARPETGSTLTVPVPVPFSDSQWYAATAVGRAYVIMGIVHHMEQCFPSWHASDLKQPITLEAWERVMQS